MKKRIKGIEENVKVLYVYVFCFLFFFFFFFCCCFVLFCFVISGGSAKGYHKEEICWGIKSKKLLSFLNLFEHGFDVFLRFLLVLMSSRRETGTELARSVEVRVRRKVISHVLDSALLLAQLVLGNELESKLKLGKNWGLKARRVRAVCILARSCKCERNEKDHEK